MHHDSDLAYGGRDPTVAEVTFGPTITIWLPETVGLPVETGGRLAAVRLPTVKIGDGGIAEGETCLDDDVVEWMVEDVFVSAAPIGADTSQAAAKTRPPNWADASKVRPRLRLRMRAAR